MRKFLVSKKMTKAEMENYQEIEVYRDLSIMSCLMVENTKLQVTVRSGTYEGDDFILRLPSVNQSFDKSDGMVNCLMRMAAGA